MNSESILVLIMLLIVVPVGIILILFASRMGTWVFNFYLEIKNSLSYYPKAKRLFTIWSFPRATEWHSLGLYASIWLLRIMGIFCIGMAAFALYLVLFKS